MDSYEALKACAGRWPGKSIACVSHLDPPHCRIVEVGRRGEVVATLGTGATFVEALIDSRANRVVPEQESLFPEATQ